MAPIHPDTDHLVMLSDGKAISGKNIVMVLDDGEDTVFTIQGTMSTAKLANYLYIILSRLSRDEPRAVAAALFKFLADDADLAPNPHN